jgi:hypothetical protein
MALSTKQVNARLAQFGLEVSKVDNSYFVLVDASGNVFASVYVSSLSHLSLSAWEAEGRAAAAAYEPAPVVADSVSAMLRQAAASFAKDAYKTYLAEAEKGGVRRSLARRQWRKVHGSSRAA